MLHGVASVSYPGLFVESCALSARARHVGERPSKKRRWGGGGGEGEIGRETRLYSSFTDYKFSSEEIQNFGKSKNRAERNDIH